MVDSTGAGFALVVLPVPKQIQLMPGRHFSEEGANKSSAKVKDLQGGGQVEVFDAQADGGGRVDGIGLILLKVVPRRGCGFFLGGGVEEGFELVDLAEIAVSGHIACADPPVISAVLF